ncbi:hypothetical protein [Haemophilus influenzae]
MLVKTQCGNWHKTLIINIFLKINQPFATRAEYRVVLSSKYLCLITLSMHPATYSREIDWREKHEVDNEAKCGLF